MPNQEMLTTNGQMNLLSQKTANESDSTSHNHNHQQQNQHTVCNANWATDGSLTDAQLTQVLIQTLLPSFAKEIRLQALVAYQVDGSCNRSFIVNRCFKRRNTTTEQTHEVDTNGICKENEKEEPVVEIKQKCSDTRETKSPLNDSGVECGSADVTISVKREAPNDPTSSSRRKRKFCRPCKIQQTPTSTPPLTIQSNPDSLASFPLVKLKYKPQPMHLSDTLPCPLLSAYLGVAGGTEQQQSQQPIPIPIQPTSVPNTQTLKHSNNIPRPIRPRILPNQSQSLTPIPPLSPQQPIEAITSSTNGEVNSNGTDSQDDNWTLSRRYAKSFVCNQCKLVFVSLNALCEHTYALHKAFRCNFCGAQFTQRSNLQRHSLRHVGFKPFVCGVCAKEYYRKDHLVRHIELTHVGTDAKNNIIVKLSSAECLDYLDSLTEQNHPENHSPSSLPSTLPPTTLTGTSLADTISSNPSTPAVVMTSMEHV